jgi:hypothetical protein
MMEFDPNFTLISGFFCLLVALCAIAISFLRTPPYQLPEKKEILLLPEWYLEHLWHEHGDERWRFTKREKLERERQETEKAEKEQKKWKERRSDSFFIPDKSVEAPDFIKLSDGADLRK